MGRGRWDADTLAEELCCSRRTIFRLFQTLSYAGVPWYFDEAKKAYRVRPGFKFPGIEHSSGQISDRHITQVQRSVSQIIAETQQLLDTLQAMKLLTEEPSSGKSPS